MWRASHKDGKTGSKAQHQPVVGVQKAVSHQEEVVSETVWLYGWCVITSALLGTPGNHALAEEHLKSLQPLDKFHGLL